MLQLPTKSSKACLLVPSFCLLLMYAGCNLRVYSPECRDFTNLSREQQRSEFQRQPVEKQLDLYLCKMSEHPSDISYADPIADRGPEVIPLVLARMRRADDTDKAKLLYIMEALSDRGHLRQRVDVYAELSKMVDEMNPVTRGRCEERLKKIAINSGIKQFTYTSCRVVPGPGRRS
jgi:hypothetical protein